MNSHDAAIAALTALAELEDTIVHDSPAGLPISSDEYDDMPVFEFGKDGARVFMIVSRDGARLSLDWLEAVPRGRGNGAAVLRLLLDLADANGVDVVTIPKGGEAKVVELYERHGFVVQPSGEKWLYRAGNRAAANSE